MEGGIFVNNQKTKEAGVLPIKLLKGIIGYKYIISFLHLLNH